MIRSHNLKIFFSWNIQKKKDGLFKKNNNNDANMQTNEVQGIDGG